MSEAARLRAQKAYSTDPEYLERMAREEEASASRPLQAGAQASDGPVVADARNVGRSSE